MTEQTISQNIETSVLVMGAVYAFSFINGIIWLAERTGFYFC